MLSFDTHERIRRSHQFRAARRQGHADGTILFCGDCLFTSTRRGEVAMARKYSRKASAKVERAMKKRKAGTLKSGRSGKKVKSRKQAIAIGLSEARREGKKVPPKKGAKKKAAKKKTAKKRKAKR
jgi:hypothetical protein